LLFYGKRVVHAVMRLPNARLFFPRRKKAKGSRVRLSTLGAAYRRRHWRRRHTRYRPKLKTTHRDGLSSCDLQPVALPVVVRRPIGNQNRHKRQRPSSYLDEFDIVGCASPEIRSSSSSSESRRRVTTRACKTVDLVHTQTVFRARSDHSDPPETRRLIICSERQPTSRKYTRSLSKRKTRQRFRLMDFREIKMTRS